GLLELVVVNHGAAEGFGSSFAVLKARDVNRAPDVTSAHATVATLWPPNHDLTPIAIAGVSDPDGDAYTIEVESVTQDEAVKKDSDAEIEQGRARVRMERDGDGNGRVDH